MVTKKQMKNRMSFRDKCEVVQQEITDEEESSGYPSPLRVERAMRLFHGMPQYVVEMTMNRLYPNVTRAFAVKVVEAMIDISETTDVQVLQINPQRAEWLKRWAKGHTEVMSVEDKEPYELFTESGKKAVEKAIAAGLIVETEGGYDWQETKVLLSYFCGRVICGDRINKGVKNSKPWYRGEKNFPASQVNALFTIKGKRATNVDGSRQDRLSSQMTVPKGYEKVEECLSGLF